MTGLKQTVLSGGKSFFTAVDRENSPNRSTTTYCQFSDVRSHPKRPAIRSLRKNERFAAHLAGRDDDAGFNGDEDWPESARSAIIGPQ
jgi:hypothetical protein